MSYSFAILVHHKLKELVEPVLRERAKRQSVAVNIIAVDAIYEEGVRIIENLQEKLDMVLCGRIHADLLREKGITCPLIAIRPRDGDIMQNIIRAAMHDSVVSVISHMRPAAVIESARHLFVKMGITVEETVFQENEEMEAIIQTLISQGRKTFVCGTMAYNYLQSKPEVNKFYFFTKEGVAETIDQALDFLTHRDYISGWGPVKVFMEQISLPAIVCDQQGKVKFLNTLAESLIGRPQEYASGLELGDILESVHWKSLKAGQIIYYNYKYYQVRLEPLEGKGGYSLVILKALEAGQGKEQETAAQESPIISFDSILGESQIVADTKVLAKQYALTGETVLIIGETGVGKDIFAQSIHNYSSRRKGPFWAINCAALPENLLESELFGYEEGAFTGASKGGKIGYFELADHGTIFLDEIGEISLNVQVKLLRVLERRQILRLGGKHFIPVDVRIICATNRDLYQAMLDNIFREDLFYRINVLQLVIAPLRERRDDIPFLVRHFYQMMEPGNRNVDREAEAFMEIFEGYYWPGNIREVENILRRYLVMKKIFHTKKELKAAILKTLKFTGDNLPDNEMKQNKEAEEKEEARSLSKEMLLDKIRDCRGNRTKAARELGISRVTLWRKLNNAD